jgi:predicted aspartyl protease
MAAPQSFTVRAPGQLRELITQCWICPAFDPALHKGAHPKFFEFLAIWDTGATNSVISPKVVEACGLKQIGMAQVTTAHETHLAEQYSVNIGLPNGVAFHHIRVTSQNLTTTPVLIGMDIIGAGDFVVTNKNGKTVFSFRCPSSEEIDFVQADKSAPLVKPGTELIGRNWKCPCGSGKRYKNCHGKGAH